MESSLPTTYIYLQLQMLQVCNTSSEMDSTHTPFPLESVSDEEFNHFHTIDRELYARLVLNLGRARAESMKVMAFWIWLERESRDMKLIKRLLSLPLLLLNKLADETRLCLMSFESNEFQHHDNNIQLLPEIWPSWSFDLRYFHENRDVVSRSVAEIMETICIRAFHDIPRRVVNPHHLNAPFLPLHSAVAGGSIHMTSAMGQLPIHIGDFPTFDVAVTQRHNIGGTLSLNVRREENVVPLNLPLNDRTIFLTFSTGYPIAEEEVKGYFTRAFGDFIEDLIFQDVENDEQVLYARMVVKSAEVGIIEDIVGRGNKAKYKINGKHVWARKYESRSPRRGGP